MNDRRLATRRGRIAIVEQLRGLAAFSVVWYHVTLGNPNFLDQGLIKSSGTYGWLGVEVFFVISGFIIPHAMYRAHYRASGHLPGFLAKRLVRLEPPYLATVALCVVLGYVSFWVPGFRGAPPDFPPMRLALHIGYLVGFTDYVWINPVFWSLAIEFQYYLAMALLFPMIASERTWIRCSAVTLLFAASFLPIPDLFLVPYLSMFTLGMVTFHFSVGWLDRRTYLTAIALMATIICLGKLTVIGLAGLATALAIAFIRGEGFKPLVWLGTISYSLYLVHVPIGGRVINLGESLDTEGLTRIGFLVAAVAISIGSAYLFNRLFERPAQLWASKFHYGKARPVHVSTPVVEESV